MSPPATVFTGVMHDRIAWPLTMTVQAPHCPRPQPNFGPFSASSSLSTYRSGVAGSTSTLTARLLTRKLKFAMSRTVTPKAGVEGQVDSAVNWRCP